MEHVLVEGRIRHQLLEPAVFLLHLPQPPQLRDAHPGERAPPAGEGLRGDAQLAADLDDRGARFGLPQGIDDLLLGEPTLLQSRPPSRQSEAAILTFRMDQDPGCRSTCPTNAVEVASDSE